MNISKAMPYGSDQSQQFLRQYSANAFLPSIDWVELFKQSRLNETHVQALDTLYHRGGPTCLNN